MRFMVTVFRAFLARQKPVSIMAKPMCMNITTIAAKRSQITPLVGMADGPAGAAGSAACKERQVKVQAAAVPAEINRRFRGKLMNMIAPFLNKTQERPGSNGRLSVKVANVCPFSNPKSVNDPERSLSGPFQK